MKVLAKYLLIILILLSSTTALAVAPVWKIVPKSSSLIFIATQNGAPVKGSFQKFSGNINFDPNQLSESKIKIVVDMNSLFTQYSDLTATLQTPDWFNVKLFPEAIFESSLLGKTSEDHYFAKGMLTIRNTSLPVTLTFTIKYPTPTTAIVNGSTTLKRTMFGVGQGEWSSVAEVQDDVEVKFVVNAVQ